MSSIKAVSMFWVFLLLRVESVEMLALHGGGGSPESLENLLSPLKAILGTSVNFTYASSPVTGGIWYEDPPGGKNVPTTDPDWASNSITYLDNLYGSHGPFDGVLGYSQGGAMSIVYLAENVSRFNFAVILCGYLPETHLGLMGKIDTASPMNVPSLFYSGTQDAIIPTSLTVQASTKFVSAKIMQDQGGHVPPQSGYALETLADYILSNNKSAFVVNGSASDHKHDDDEDSKDVLGPGEIAAIAIGTFAGSLLLVYGIRQLYENKKYIYNS